MRKLLLFFFPFIVSTSFATHNSAGDITYRYIGTVSNPYQYEITVKTYTKWVGPSSTDKCELNIHFGDGDTAIAPRVNGTSINCTSGSADGVLIGGCAGNIRMNVYVTTHNYPGLGTYYISMEDPNRSSGLCNVTNSINTSFYLEAKLVINPFYGNNSAPVYNEVADICNQANIINYYNPLAVDSDGDSLHYQLITPMANGGYLSGYYLPSSTTSFTIDNISGILTWDSPPWICEYVFAIRVYEWRNISGTSYLIGESMQEVHSTVKPFVSISENTQSIHLNIYPNPSNGLINFTIENASQNQEYQIVINNSLGQIVKTLTLNNNSAVINEGELSAGLYFYSLFNKTEVLNKEKFVILGGITK